jgi:NAD-dependent deacetylase
MTNNTTPTKFSQTLLDQIHTANSIVVITGAGISADSGIRTFRDAQSGLWKEFNPEELASRKGWQANKERVWAWYESRRAQVLAAHPNSGHLAISWLQVARRTQVFTQNVDNLHERAGSTDVRHFHGSLFSPRCFACAKEHKEELPLVEGEVASLRPPQCEYCGGYIRPGVVWFGEPLPSKVVKEAEAAIATCDVLLFVGTSAQVYPVASFILDKGHRHKRSSILVEVNAEVTDASSVADYSLIGNASDILPSLLKEAL